MLELMCRLELCDTLDLTAPHAAARVRIAFLWGLPLVLYMQNGRGTTDYVIAWREANSERLSSCDEGVTIQYV